MLAFEDQCLHRGYQSIRDCSGSSMSRRRRFCPRLHRQRSRCEVPALRVRASLRVAGFGESSVSRVDSGKYPQGDRALGSYPQRWRAEPTVDLGSALRQGRVHTAARLDVLCAGDSLSRPQARQSGKIPRPAGLCLGTFSRATQSRVVVHCASQWRIEPGPGWCNGSHAGLKIQCPRGRAGSTPAPGTIP